MIDFPKTNGSYARAAGRFSLPKNLRAATGDFEDWCLTAFAARLGLQQGAGKPWLTLERDAGLPREGYRLRISPEEIHIEANSEEGVIYALTTAYLRLEEDALSCCRIQDGPRHPHRGLSLDCVRHFFPMEEVKKIVEQMALVKMNVLHFHLSDDQGFRIESRRFPKLNETGGEFYRREELLDLVSFARDRGIAVIPEIDLPGHTSAILAAFPELGCTGKAITLPKEGGVYNTILCGGSESVYRFLEELLGEITEIFPDSRFHIGGDEAPKSQWRSCPCCREKLKSLGSGDFEELQAYFTRRVADILNRRGKSPICWNETLKGRDLPDNLTIQYWTLENLPALRAYIKKGGTFLFSAMTELYLDYPHAMTSVRKMYRMRPRIWGRSCTGEAGFLGLEAALWTEHISTCERLENQLFPRLYIAAEKGWSRHKPYAAFLRELRSLCALAARAGIAPMPEEGWNPAGARRRQESLDFFAKMNGGVLEEALPENLEKASPDLRLMASYVTRFFRLQDLPALAKLYFH